MKKLLFIIVVLSFTLIQQTVYSQTGLYIVGDESKSTIIHDFGDKILEPPDDANYGTTKIDLDGNEKWDIKFILSEYGDGWGGGADINIQSSDSTYLYVDTTAVYWTGPPGGITPDTISKIMATKHNYGDTLNIDGKTSRSALIATYSTGSYPDYYWYITSWYGGTHYIVFKKVTDSEVLYGWLEVEVYAAWKMALFKLAYMNNSLGFPELSEKVKVGVYPNPAYNSIRIVNNSNERVKQISIFNLSGQLMLQTYTADKKIDVSAFNSGMYIVQIETEKSVYSKKLMVQ